MEQAEEFYRELDPVKRQAILEGGLAEQNPLYRKLWEARFGKRKPKVDAFIGYLMDLKYLSEVGTTDFGGKKRKEAAAMINGMMLDGFDDRPQEEQTIIYQELMNVVRRYIAVSQKGRGFTSVIFGMGELSDESVIKKLADQLSVIAFRAPHQLQMHAEFAPLQKAVLQVFKEDFPNREHLINK